MAAVERAAAHGARAPGGGALHIGDAAFSRRPPSWPRRSLVQALSAWLRGIKIPDDIKLPLFIVGTLATFLALYFLREMMIPFSIAILLTYLLRPAVVVLAHSLDYLLSCCGAQCCLDAQSRASRGWSRFWASAGERLCWCCAAARKKRAAAPPAGSGGPPLTVEADLEALRRSKAAQYKCWDAESDGSQTGDDTAPLNKPGAAAAGGAPARHAPVDPTAFYSVSCSRLTAVILATALALGVIAVLVLILVDSITSFHERYWPTFAPRFDAVMHNIVAWIHDNLHFEATSLLSVADSLGKELSSASTLMSIAAAIIVVVVTLLLMMFLLLDERLDARAAPAGAGGESDAETETSDEEARGGGSGGRGAPALVERRARRAVASMWADIDAAIHRYLVAKTLVSLAMGLLVFLVLGPILHVKLAHLFGVLTVLLNFIPNIGSLIAALIPLPVILLDPALSSTAQALAIVVPLVIHFVIGNFVEPFVLGPLLSLHPVVVLLALSFWFVLWGVAGAILGVPVTSVICIALKRSGHAYADFIVVLLEELRIDLALLRGPPRGGDGRAGGAGADGAGDGADPGSLGGSGSSSSDGGGGGGHRYRGRGSSPSPGSGGGDDDDESGGVARRGARRSRQKAGLKSAPPADGAASVAVAVAAAAPQGGGSAGAAGLATGGPAGGFGEFQVPPAGAGAAASGTPAHASSGSAAADGLPPIVRPVPLSAAAAAAAAQQTQEVRQRRSGL